MTYMISTDERDRAEDPCQECGSHNVFLYESQFGFIGAYCVDCDADYEY